MTSRRYRGLIIAVEKFGEYQIIGITHWKDTEREAKAAARRMWKRSHTGKHHLLRCYVAVVFEEHEPERIFSVDSDEMAYFKFMSRKRSKEKI